MELRPAAPPSPWAAVIDRHQLPLACLIAIVFLMALHQSYNLVTQPYDAAEYWLLSHRWDFARAPSYRGYVFPALLAPLNFLCGLTGYPALTFRFGMSVAYGVLLTVLVPAVFQQAFGGRLSLLRRLVPVILLAALFPGVLLYCLSDLPALLLALSALLWTLRALQETASRARLVGKLAAAGALMAAAYYTRTIYLFAFAGLLALMAFRGRSSWAAFPRWLGLAAVAAGALLVALPQLAINIRTQGVNSLAVQSIVNKQGLFASQMVWGMTLQRYETTLNAEAPGPSVYYFDPAGARLFDEAARRGNPFSLPYYLKVVATHPLDFLALYARHVINGLDVRDGLVYIVKPSPLRNRTAQFNFLVLALAICVALSVRTRRSADPGFRPVPAAWPFSLAVLALPVAAIVPGAVETRFFLPLHLLAYCVIAMHFEASTLWRELKLHRWKLLAAAVVAASLFFAVSLNTMAHMQYAWPDIYRHGPPK